MQVKGDTMSFMYNISGNFEPEYKKVICKNTGEGVEIKVDGKMIDTNPSIEGEEEKKEEPKIGDSEYDVRLSSWGAPKKINRTKTGSMISEQWVYDNNRYIYLDNGKVTAIQD